MRRLGLIFVVAAMLIAILAGVWVFSRPERGTTGSVSTRFRFLGPNDKIVVDGFDDPKVEGVACHISRAQTGGIKAAWAWPRTPATRALPAAKLARSRLLAN